MKSNPGRSNLQYKSRFIILHWHIKYYASTFHGNGRFGSMEVPWMSNLRNRFIGPHKIFYGQIISMLINEGKTQTLFLCLFSLVATALFSLRLIHRNNDVIPVKRVEFPQKVKIKLFTCLEQIATRY